MLHLRSPAFCLLQLCVTSFGSDIAHSALFLEHSHFFPPYLGARNTFYGHAKQKVGVRVRDFLTFTFFFSTLMKLLAKFYVVLQSFVRRELF